MKEVSFMYINVKSPLPVVKYEQEEVIIAQNSIN